uniref:doxx family protein n=2 Tax=Roseivirga sp. TaxID=1964215 RepID=UPI004048E942
MDTLYLFFDKHQHQLLRISIGVLFIWFGLLKFFPGASPAERLATDTIQILTFHLIPASINFKILATMELLLGLLLVFSKEYKITFWLLVFHMLATFTPLFILSDVTFKQVPFKLSLEGQYIIKNLVILCCAFILLIAHRAKRVKKRVE